MILFNKQLGLVLDFFNHLELKDYLAIWGALLSSSLGVVKLFELWRDRHHIEVGYSFTSDEVVGNAVIIRNLSNRQIIVTHWELFISRDKKGILELDVLNYADYDSDDFLIPANSTRTLSFNEASFFNTSYKFLRDRKIYIKLCIAGKSAVTHLVYP